MTAPDFDARAYLDGLAVLEDVEDVGRAVVFAGRNPEGGRVMLEMPRPFHLAAGWPVPRPESLPLSLTVCEGPHEAPTGRGYTFVLHLATPEGEAVKAKLDALTVFKPRIFGQASA